MRNSLGNLAEILAAGALGGGLVGLAESGLISVTSGAAEEYWLFLFAVIAYGGLGALMGLGGGALWWLLRKGWRGEAMTAHAAMFVGVGAPAFVVGRYHVAQRVFHEDLVLGSPVGVLTHGLLLLGAVAVGFLGTLLLRGCSRAGGRAGAAVAVAVLGGLAAVIGMSAGAPATPRAERRAAPPRLAGKPNIVLIIADTLRADAVDSAGGPTGATPGLARFAQDAIDFEHAYAQSSWTRPSIATILTSQYPSVHGAIHKMDILPERVMTLAEALRREGYWTAGFVNNINVAPVFNFQKGFDEFAYLAPNFYFGASDSATRLAIYKGLRVVREKVSHAMYFQHYYQNAGVLNDHVSRWLDEHPPEPFFLVMHYMDPHDPYFEHPYNGRGVARVMNPTPPAARAGELHGLYRGEVRYLDAQLAAFFDQFRAAGLYDRSVIAFTADHGEEFQEHGGWWHGTTLYDEALQVPLLIKGIGGAPRGQRRADRVRTLDIAPTLMAGAAVPIPALFAGKNLFGGAVTEPLFAEEDLEGNQLDSIRVGEWKLIRANRTNPRGLAPVELFNVQADPGEVHNLADREPARVKSLLAELDRFRTRLSMGTNGPQGAD